MCVYCGVRYQRGSDGAPAVPTVAVPERVPVAVRGVAIVFGVVVVGAVMLGMVTVLAALMSDEAPPVEAAEVVADRRVEGAPVAASEGRVSVAAPKEEVAPATAEFTLETVDRTGTGAVWIYGYLRNTSPFTLGKTKITAVFYDAAGAEVGQGSGYTGPDVIAAQERVPTVLLVSDAPASYERLAFEVQAQRPSYVPAQVEGLELVADPPRVDRTLGWRFVGKVHNRSGQPARFVRVDVFGFNDEDKLAGHTFTYASADALADGATARFEATMYGSKAALKRFEFAVRGQPVR